MQEQLRDARTRGWCYSGVVPLGNDKWGQTDSVNERRTVEALRFAADLLTMVVKPTAIEWVDRQGNDHRYSPDARVELLSGDTALVELKPVGVLTHNMALTARYEEIGRYLQEKGKLRFGLMEWQWNSVFARNISRLSRYWNVEPGTHAVDAFEAIGDCEVTLAQLFDRVDQGQWPAVWAAIAKQHLTTDLHAGPLSRASRVSQPWMIYEPVFVDAFITTWWA